MFRSNSKSAGRTGLAWGRVRHREAAGVVIIALMILAFTLARYWHNIAWSAR